MQTPSQLLSSRQVPRQGLLDLLTADVDCFLLCLSPWWGINLCQMCSDCVMRESSERLYVS